jgi:hypothetical protein
MDIADGCHSGLFPLRLPVSDQFCFQGLRAVQQLGMEQSEIFADSLAKNLSEMCAVEFC